jgi:hypothetical protein
MAIIYEQKRLISNAMDTINNPQRRNFNKRVIIYISIVLCLLISLILLNVYWQALYKNITSSSSVETIKQTGTQTQTVTTNFGEETTLNKPLSVESQQAIVNKLILDTPLNAQDEAKPVLDHVNNVQPPINETTREINERVDNNSHNEAMRVQTRHIPNSNKQKMTDLLPDELKYSIKQSLLTDEQVRSLNDEERKAYQRTQREIVRTLRELAGLEAENQHLKTMINEKEQTNESLNKEILALRKYFQ